MTKTIAVRGRLVSVASQRLQYKPYGYGLAFDAPSPLSDAVLVEIEIPRDSVIEEGDGCVVVSLEGMTAILEGAADALDALDRKYQKRIMKGEH